MDVAGGDGEAGGLHACTAHLHGGGVGTAEGQDLELVLDVVLLGHGGEFLGQFKVADDGGILQLDGRAAAYGAGHGLGTGGVTGAGHVVGNADIGVDAEGRGLGTAHTHLLLDGEDEVDIVGHGGLLQTLGDLDQHGTADAVIQGTAGDAAAQEAGNTAIQGAEVTDLDLSLGLLLVLGTDVDVALIGAQLGGSGIDLGHQDALEAACEGDLRERGGDPVDTADGVDADEAAVLDVGYQEADLVHVGAEHDLLLLGLGGGAVLDGDEVAHGVVVALIRDGGNDGQKLIRNGLLAAGNGARGGESLNEVEHVFFLHILLFVMTRLVFQIWV